MSISKIRRQLDQLHARKRAEKENLKRQKSQLLSLQEDLEYSIEAREILQNTAEAVQARVHSRIAGLVSKCLSTVFDEPYEFVVSFEKKRGKTEARLFFKREGQEIDPMTASGGGVVDVAAFALRLACLMLSRPPLRRVMVMDEPFKFVSEEYRSNVKAMLEELSTELSIQFIMVTHIPELVTGKIVRI